MIAGVAVIAGLTTRELLRRRVFVVVLVLTALFLALYGVALPGVALAAAVVVIAALSLLGSVLLATIPNGILILMLFGAGLVAGLLGQIGDALPSERLQTIGTVAAWALPFEALYQAGL